MARSGTIFGPGDLSSYLADQLLANLSPTLGRGILWPRVVLTLVYLTELIFGRPSVGRSTSHKMAI